MSEAQRTEDVTDSATPCVCFAPTLLLQKQIRATFLFSLDCFNIFGLQRNCRSLRPFLPFSLLLSTSCMHWIALFKKEVGWSRYRRLDIMRSSWTLLLSEEDRTYLVSHPWLDGAEDPISATSRSTQQLASEFTKGIFPWGIDKTIMSTPDQKSVVNCARRISGRMHTWGWPQRQTRPHTWSRRRPRKFPIRSSSTAFQKVISSGRFDAIANRLEHCRKFERGRPCFTINCADLKFLPSQWCTLRQTNGRIMVMFRFTLSGRQARERLERDSKSISFLTAVPRVNLILMDFDIASKK